VWFIIHLEHIRRRRDWLLNSPAFFPYRSEKLHVETKSLIEAVLRNKKIEKKIYLKEPVFMPKKKSEK